MYLIAVDRKESLKQGQYKKRTGATEKELIGRLWNRLELKKKKINNVKERPDEIVMRTFQRNRDGP